MPYVSTLLYGPAFFCFAASCWAVKWHFRRTDRIPAGIFLITALTLAGFGWFTWRVVFGAASTFWAAALTLFIVSACLFIWTITATRKSPPTLVFDTDEPGFLLNHGPYTYIRHPFYTSYLLFWTGTALATPGLAPWLVPAVMLGVYWNAARREEQKFARSRLSSAYQTYRQRTGMFLPRLRLGQRLQR